jgi:hypothetical protein
VDEVSAPAAARGDEDGMDSVEVACGLLPRWGREEACRDRVWRPRTRGTAAGEEVVSGADIFGGFYVYTIKKKDDNHMYH